MGTLVSSTSKTDHHDITEILLNVALNVITPFKYLFHLIFFVVVTVYIMECLRDYCVFTIYFCWVTVYIMECLRDYCVFTIYFCCSFNQLCLPSYTTMEQMHKCMMTAINEGFQGFGFVWNNNEWTFLYQLSTIHRKCTEKVEFCYDRLKQKIYI